MNGFSRRVAALLFLIAPGGIEAQCAIDMVEAGVQAYRALELETAKRMLREAVELNSQVSSPCSTENARALTYLGASHWLEERRDSAARAFELAVIQAPRFRPDDVEFPPELTRLFDVVRRGTPAVIATLPEEVRIGPEEEDETLPVMLAASTSHRVTVSVRSRSRGPVRVLYGGLVEARAEEMVVEWDGRDAEGRPVASGPYDLEIVSEDSLYRPIRKVVVALTVEVDAPPAPVVVDPRSSPMRTVELSTQSMRGTGDRNVAGAVAIGGLGLLSGALVAGLPLIVDTPAPPGVRYSVAGGLALAGIVGFFRALGGGEPRSVARPPALESMPAERISQSAPAPGPPTIRITSGHQQRIEVAG